MLRKLILTAVLSSVAISLSYVSFAQGVTWTGRYRPYLTSKTEKDGEGKDRTSMYIAGTARTMLNYSGEVMDGWTTTATIGLNWTNADAREVNHSDGGVVANRNFNIGMSNDSFGITLGTTQYLGGVANTGGAYSGYNSGINMYSAVDEGDLSSRIGSIGIEVKGLPVVIKAGFGTSSATYVADDDNANPDAESVEQTHTELGLLVRYDHADYSAGLMYVSNVADLKTIDAGGVEAADKTDKSSTVIGGNYNLASNGVPLNLWLLVQINAVKTTAGVDEIESNEGSATQLNLGLDYSYGAGNVGFTYAATTFEKPKVGDDEGEESPTETNLIAWVDYTLPWGTGVFFNLGTSTYEDKNVEDKSADRSVTQWGVGLNQSF